MITATLPTSVIAVIARQPLNKIYQWFNSDDCQSLMPAQSATGSPRRFNAREALAVSILSTFVWDDESRQYRLVCPDDRRRGEGSAQYVGPTDAAKATPAPPLANVGDAGGRGGIETSCQPNVQTGRSQRRDQSDRFSFGE